MVRYFTFIVTNGSSESIIKECNRLQTALFGIEIVGRYKHSLSSQMLKVKITAHSSENLLYGAFILGRSLALAQLL